MLHFGPLNKSLFTQELELVTKCLLYTFETAIVYTNNESPKSELHVKFDDIDINMSSLYAKANFNHIQLDAKDSDNYISKINPHDYYGYDDPLKLNAVLNVPVIEPLTSAEIKAIRDYTGSGYSDINSVLYGNSKWVWHEKEAIIEGIFVASGINKIMPSQDDVYTYRGESSISEEQLQHRIDLVDLGGGVTCEPAFMSTSIDFRVAMSFLGFGENNKSMIIFEDAYGKNIADFSYFQNEKEFLLAPSTVLWDGYEYKDGIHFFHAKVVSSLDAKEKPTEEDYQIFSKLLNWANIHGISTDFVTPFLKNQLENGELNPDVEDNTNPLSEVGTDAIILSDASFIELEKSDWLACVDDLVAHYHNFVIPQFNLFNEILSQEVIHFDDVITSDVTNEIDISFSVNDLKDPIVETSMPVVTMPLVTPVEIVSVETLVIC